jgi:hypothetical protein
MMKPVTIISRYFLLPFLLIAAAKVRADDSATFTAGGLTFTRPAKWESVEPSSEMRKAQLKVTDPDSKASAEVIFFVFETGSGGGVQANVDRWFHQFSEPKEQINAKQEEVTVGKTKITYVQAEGTFKSGMPGGDLTPMSDYALCGAIIETDSANIIVKMTGPKALVKASVADFKKMIESGPKKD